MTPTATSQHRDTGSDWAELYGEMAAQIPALARAAPLTLAGMGTCIDAIVPLAELDKLDRATAPKGFVDLYGVLTARAAAGIGGEIRVDWPEGPAWLRERLPLRLDLGGTGPQAARVLAALNAPVLVALEDRSGYMLDRFPPGISLASGGRLAEAAEIVARGTPRPEIFIFEFTAGVPVGSVTPTRSSRIIARFGDPDIERDAEFDALSTRLAGQAGAALVSGFSSVHISKIDEQMSYVTDLVRGWRAAGLRTVHLELATFADNAVLGRVLDAVPGAFTSLGMSESEFGRQVAGADASPEKMLALAGKLQLDRLCVHADHWAAAVTRGDPRVERRALACGSLLAATRAAEGRPARPRGVPEGARFAALPFPENRALGDWTFVCVAAPYLAVPVTTLGLGDSFTAGCLLVLGQRTAWQTPAPTDGSSSDVS